MVKNTLKTVIILVLAWALLPTGDPSDIFITLPIINAIGMGWYTVISLVVIIVLYKTIEGRGLKAKFNNIKKEIKRLIKW